MNALMSTEKQIEIQETRLIEDIANAKLKNPIKIGYTGSHKTLRIKTLTVRMQEIEYDRMIVKAKALEISIVALIRLSLNEFIDKE